jgi:hypothetical protein
MVISFIKSLSPRSMGWGFEIISFPGKGVSEITQAFPCTIFNGIALKQTVILYL